MNIAYFSSAVIPSRQANSVHVMRMCAAFAENGHSLRLLARRGADPDADREQVHRFYGTSRDFPICYLPWLPIPGKNYLLALIGALRISPRRTDLVYGRNLHGCYLCALRGCEVIFETHTTGENWTTIERHMFRRLLRSPGLKGLVVISQPLRDHYLRCTDLDASHILVCSDAADDASHVTPQALTRRGSLSVGYTGHLYPGRGTDLIVELAVRCPWADFHLVGGDPGDIEQVRGVLDNPGNLFVHGFVSPAETARYIRAFDVTLAPYQKKVGVHGGGDTSAWMSPMKLFEYMAGARPIVASDLPVFHEVLRDGTNCLLCPPDDIDAWIRALTRLNEDLELRTSLANNAYQDFTNQHSWRARAERVLGHFDLAA